MASLHTSYCNIAHLLSTICPLVLYLFVASFFVVSSRLRSLGTLVSVWPNIACSHARLCCDLIGFHKPRLGQVRTWLKQCRLHDCLLATGKTQQKPRCCFSQLRPVLWCWLWWMKYWGSVLTCSLQWDFTTFYEKNTDVNNSVLAHCKSFKSLSGL